MAPFIGILWPIDDSSNRRKKGNLIKRGRIDAQLFNMQLFGRLECFDI